MLDPWWNAWRPAFLFGGGLATALGPIADWGMALEHSQVAVDPVTPAPGETPVPVDPIVVVPDPLPAFSIEQCIGILPDEELAPYGIGPLAVPGSTGTRLVCVSGPVKRPGYYEFEMGKLTMRQLIEDVCGGVKDGKKIKGVIPGGSSMPVLPANNLDVPLDFESLRKAGTMAGSGGIVVLTEDVSIVDATLNVSQFYAHESCGQCTPCREGTLWMEKMLHRIKEGHGRPEDVDLLFEVADNIDGKTICPLGEAAAWPVKAFLKNYRSEFEAACKKNGNG